MKPARVLVVAAHPDDELLGCGGAVARHAAEGARVRSLVLGEGVTSRKGLSPAARRAALAKLRADARRANARAGVEKLTLLSFPDNRFDTVARLELVQAVEKEVAAFRPERVYTHSSADLNVDHRLVAEAVRTACRPLPGSTVREVLAFEIASSTEWRFDGSAAFRPSLFIDVSRHLEAKLAALACYEGEMRPFPHPRSEQYLRALATVRGAQSGLDAAEAFELVRAVEPR